MAKVTLNVQYCGGWGYKRYCNALAVAVADEFGDDVEVIGQRDAGVTGNFNVVLAQTGELIFSKAKYGGRCETDEQRSVVFAKIREYLEKA